MNLYDKVAEAIGHTPFLMGFSVATVIWTTLGVVGIDKDFAAFTVALSILAIYTTIFIQHSQNKQAKRFEQFLKADLKNTKEVKKMLERILAYQVGRSE